MDKVYDDIYKNVEEAENVVVACSGGPDSMCLLHILCEIRKEKNINIICAHVNHNLRKESEQEKEFVQNFCIENNIDFEYFFIEKYTNNKFTENEARRIRYDFFDKVMHIKCAKLLLTGHHGDDLVETILMRITRGSTIKGYSGFSKLSNRKNYYIFRPLINVTKNDILEFNNKNNIEYVIDNSNISDKYTRNRYRKNILPALKEENKNVHNLFNKFGNILRDYDNYVSLIVNEKIKNVYRDNILNINEFNKLDKFIMDKIIYKIFENLYKDNLEFVSDKHVKIVLNLINSKKSNNIIELPNKLFVSKKYNKLIFEFEKKIFYDYKYEFSNEVILSNNRFIRKIDDTDNDSNFICRLNSNEIKLPLFIRNKRNGDFICVKNLNGSKKVKDIFIDEKVDINERKSWPILVDSDDNILWIPGLKKSKFNKTKQEKYDIILKYN